MQTIPINHKVVSQDQQPHENSVGTMVAFPLLIVAATLGYSMVDPEGKSLVPSSFSSSSSSRSSSNVSASRWVFGYGVVLGMGLSSALSYELRRRRIWERVRVTLSSWLKESSALVLGNKYRRPTQSDSVEGMPILPDRSNTKQNNDRTKNAPSCGIQREVVSPDWCFTSTMTVTIVTIYAGSELNPRMSVGVEFYYVLKGEGLCIQGKGEHAETMKLTPDSCLVIDPFCIRQFKAIGGRMAGDLVLLRASDSPQAPSSVSYDDDDVYGQDAGHRRQLDDSKSTPPSVELISTGLQKVEALVSKYAKTPRGDTR